METTSETSMGAVAASLRPKQKARLHEVADLMLQIYRTLERMCYLEPEWIQPGPHDLSADMMALYQSLNLDPSIIYLYHLLPYLHPAMRHHLDFYDGGDFTDFRVEDDVTQGRQPLFGDDPAERLRPWMTPLSASRNHRNVLVYDAKRHVISIFDPINGIGGSGDRNLYEGSIFMTTDAEGKERYFRKIEDGTEVECSVREWEEQAKRESDGDEDEEEEEGGEYGGGGDEGGEKKEEGGGGDVEDVEDAEDASDEDSGDEEEDDEEGEEGEEEEEENYWDEADARSAPNVLRDIIRWYHELVEFPGQGENDYGRFDKELVIPLLRKHGWPGEGFDGDAFLVDKARAEALATAKRHAEQPFDEVDSLRSQIKSYEQRDPIILRRRQDRLVTPQTVEEQCLVRWEIWQEELITQRLKRRLERAEQSIKGLSGRDLNPEDIPLLESKYLHIDLLNEKQKLPLPHHRTPEPRIQLEIRSIEKTISILEKAYAASQADAERLCPGRAPLPLVDDEDTNGLQRVKQLTEDIEEAEREVEIVRAWVNLLPDGADEAKRRAQYNLELGLSGIEWYKRQRQSCLEALEKPTGQEQANGSE